VIAIAMQTGRALPTKATMAVRLAVRRGLDEHGVAAYLSLPPGAFGRLVEQGLMPRPRVVEGYRIWDIEEVDLAFSALPRQGDETQPIAAREGDTWADFR
jgi:hypothetical protein